ncbi:MAG: B3/B4 domain-containing protein [Acidimicrobiia bacterium]
MAGFRYSKEILDAFPSVRGGIIHATGLDNTTRPAILADLYRAEQEKVRQEIGDRPLSEIPSLSAWRATFTGFGVKPTQYRSAAEALLRRLTKQGDIPSINPLVDLANLVSVRHRLPVAVFDQRAATGVTTVRFAAGHEPFTDLGADGLTNPEPGEVIFADEADVVSARRWCWRQSDQSAARSTTVEALITVEGQHEDAGDDVKRATEDLLDLFSQFQPGADLRPGFLSPRAKDFLP